MIKVEKRFNRFPQIIQWIITLTLGLFTAGIMFEWVQFASEYKAGMLLIFVIVPVLQFLCTPLFTLIRLYTYYSPMVVALGDGKRVLDLHNGTSFDYLLEMRGTRPGMEWKKKMLYFYLSALQNIIYQIENNKLPETLIIRGSSYFLSERSASKLGFSRQATSLAEKLNILLNYLDLIWMYSLSYGRLTFPNLTNIHTITISGADLIQQKGKIAGIITRMKLAPTLQKGN